MPKVSICVPTYNNLTCVEYLCASIAQQTFEDYEVIITDDSTNCQIADYILKDCVISADKIHYFHNAQPLGPIFNWNCAIEKATGEYVKIMFSDDWFTEETSLNTMVQALDAHENASMVFCGSMQVSIAKSYPRLPSTKYIEKLHQDYRYLFISNQIGAPSDILYRRNINPLFDEKSNWASDVFFYFEILKHNAEFIYIAQPLISIGIHEQQYTETFTERDERIFKDYEYLYQKYCLFENPEYRTYFLKHYLLKYHYGLLCARKNKYSFGEYIKEWILFFWNDIIVSYSIAIGRHLCRKKQD